MADIDKSAVWIVIAAFNEENSIASVLKGTKRYAENIAVVDDGSKDNTYNLARNQGVKVLRHAVNLGKGVALRTGCEFAIGQGAERIVFIDGDGQHEPKDIPRFVKALDEVDFVFSYRKFDENMPLVRKLGNWFLNFFTNILFGVNIYDTQCGFRAFNSKVYNKIRWESDRYAVETEQVMRVAKNRISFAQLPIRTIYEGRSPGTTVLDGFKIALRMLWLRLRK